MRCHGLLELCVPPVSRHIVQKNESSAVPSSNAVRNGGPLLCPNAKPPTVMPTRNTATIAGCRALTLSSQCQSTPITLIGQRGHSRWGTALLMLAIGALFPVQLVEKMSPATSKLHGACCWRWKASNAGHDIRDPPQTKAKTPARLRRGLVRTSYRTGALGRGLGSARHLFTLSRIAFGICIK